MAFATSEFISKAPHILVGEDAIYQDSVDGLVYSIRRLSNGPQEYFRQLAPDGVYSVIPSIPDTYVEVNDLMPSLSGDPSGEMTFNFFRVDGSGTFTVSARGTSGSTRDWEIFISKAPYETIPNLTLPNGVTYTTAKNADNTFSHLFAGQALQGFGATGDITGGTPSPSSAGLTPTIHIG